MSKFFEGTLDEAIDRISWLESGIAEWRSVAMQNSRQTETARATARTAITHLQNILHKAITADEQMKVDTDARDWLLSIGCHPDDKAERDRARRACEQISVRLHAAQAERDALLRHLTAFENALSLIGTVTSMLPSYKVTHEGGFDAYVQNIIDSIAAYHDYNASI